MAGSEEKTRAKDFRERSAAELESLMTAKSEELQKVGFKHALGQLRETHRIGVLRKDIAMIKTVLTEKQVETAK